MANMAQRLYRYCSERFGVGQAFQAIEDGRKDPTHPLYGLLWKTIGCIAVGLPSFNQLEEAIKRGAFDKIGAEGRPCADTFRRAFGQMAEPDQLVAVNDVIVHRARYNKALEGVTVEGYRVVAVDGTGVFSTVSRRLGDSGHYRRGVHGEKLTDDIYLEQALAVSYVGGDGPKLLLALARIPKGNGETTIGRQVLKRLFATHCRFCDVITVDALFAGGPFLNEVLAQNKEFVVRVKQADYDIIVDAEKLFERRAADEVHKDVKLRQKNVRYDVEIWEEENFTSWEQVNKPLRCLRVRETRKQVNAAGKVVKSETFTTHLVTSAPRASMPALTVWRIAHARWDVENTGFHFLKHHFQLEHAYSYDPEVIEAMLTLFMITYNLFMLFVNRNVRALAAKRQTLLGMMAQIYEGLVQLAAPLWEMEPLPKAS